MINALSRKMTTTRLLAGSSISEFNGIISKFLKVPLLERTVEWTAEGVPLVNIVDTIRGLDVFILQAGIRFNNRSINDYFMETVTMVQLCRRLGARQITVVWGRVPYFDHNSGLSALSLEFLRTVGAFNVMTFDFGSRVIPNSFRGRFDNFPVYKYVVDWLRANVLQKDKEYSILCPRSKDLWRGEEYRSRLGYPMIFADYIFDPKSPDTITRTIVTGDYRGRIVLIFGEWYGRDYIRLFEAIRVLREGGASAGIIISPSGYFPLDIITRFRDEPWITRVVVGNFLPYTETQKFLSKVGIVDMGPLVGSAIQAVMRGEDLRPLMK